MRAERGNEYRKLDIVYTSWTYERKRARKIMSICNCSPGSEINPTPTPLFAWFVAGGGANLFARFPLRSAPFANKFAPTPGNPTPGEQLHLFFKYNGYSCVYQIQR